jgi:WD40 repeat protein
MYEYPKSDEEQLWEAYFERKYSLKEYEKLIDKSFPKDTFLSAIKSSKDGKYLISWDNCGSDLCLWDLTLKKIINVFHFPEIEIVCADFSNNNKYLALGTDNGYIKIFELKKMQLIHDLKAHSSIVSSIKFSNNSELLVSKSENYKNNDLTKIWETKTFKEIKALSAEYHRGEVLFTKDDKFIIELSSSQKIGIWDVETTEIIKELDIKGLTIALSSEGDYLATIIEDLENDKIKIFNTKAFEELQTIYPRKIGLMTQSLVFSPDNKYILSNSTDGINIFHIQTGLWVMEISTQTVLPAFTNDKNYLIFSPGYDSPLSFFEFKIPELDLSLIEKNYGVKGIHVREY